VVILSKEKNGDNKMVVLHLSLLRKIMTCKESEDITLCIDLRSYSLKKNEDIASLEQ
jgi:hypothetical protein